MKSFFSSRCIGLKLAALTVCLGAHAHESSQIVVFGHYANDIGSSDSASQGVIGPELLSNRALLRPAEVLEYIPGMVVTQHSGDGKANQYFLRGMNLDHGTDFATTVNGVPINMPSHGHGHGYSDLNVLIPELVSRIQYRKGPYFAAEGDFSSAGSASIMYRSQLDLHVQAAVVVGQRAAHDHLGQGLAVQGLTRVADQDLEQLKFARGQVNGFFALFQGAFGQIQHKGAKPKARGRGNGLGGPVQTAQARLNAGQ